MDRAFPHKARGACVYTGCGRRWHRMRYCHLHLGLVPWHLRAAFVAAWALGARAWGERLVASAESRVEATMPGRAETMSGAGGRG